EAFGRSDTYAGKTVLVEFVSANPTGPLTLGHGRQAVLGDTVSRLLEAVGYKVTREYYFNDAGRQMQVLGASVQARYLELLDKPSSFPDDGYQGEYLRDIAAELIQERGDALADESDVTPFKEKAVAVIFKDISGTLERIGITFDIYFNEHDLFEEGRVDAMLHAMAERGLTYEQDGAVWFKATALGRPQDRVFVRSTGDKLPTYRVPDIAYHINKIERGYDKLIDIFGSDHIEEFPDVKAALDGLGYDTSHMSAIFHQFVTITRDGEIVKMSTRRANFVTVDELLDDVGEDVVRYFFLMRHANTHLNFDIQLAKQVSNENPVYYLQYGHARIASIFRQAAERGIDPAKIGDADLSLLRADEEVALIKKCGEYPTVLANAADEYEPQSVAHYLQEVATAFHVFYDRHRVLDDANLELSKSRLMLSKATQIVLANGLKLLGVRAPEQM
ncbi:MAG: arginine--tRNA ligase, partial [Candidatus Poribacteria bacterium]|nr:arginine--tRNA ligase [Candidatus Poribacteria bacterium]